MKKVLIITNVFPPYKGVGRHRIVQFAKYLPQYGWEPIILAPTYSYLWEKDMNTINEIPKSLRVYRAFMPIQLPVLAKNIFSLLTKKEQGQVKKRTKDTTIIKKSLKKTFVKQILIKIINTLHNFLVKYIYIPDQHIIWFPYVLFKALRIIKNDKIDIILSCSPVNSMHVFGFILKVITRKPWVTDYRDLWTGDHFHPWKGTTRVFLEKQIEKSVLHKSNTIIVNSPQTATTFCKNFPFLNPETIVVISNGFDIRSYSLEHIKYSRSDKFRIVHTGRLLNYSNSNFFDALGLIFREHPELKNRICVDLVGNISSDQRKLIDKTIDNYHLSQNINFIGWVDYITSLKYQRLADLLLLILGDDAPNVHVVVHAKLFEYIFTTRPILAIIPDGAAKDIILQTNTGHVVSPKDVENISHAVFEFYQKWKENNLYINPNWKIINQYDRKKLTGKLANLLDHLVL